MDGLNQPKKNYLKDKREPNAPIFKGDIMTTTTTIDRLREEYRQAEMHPRKSELVTDKEADETFIKFRDTFWTVLFFVLLVASILIPAIIGE
jgi:hypothetical protein